MGVVDFIKRLRPGRRRHEPIRETLTYPTLMQLGQRPTARRFVYKPTPRNLRYFGHTPYGRRGINAIKNPIKMLDWEIVPLKGIDINPELERQIEIATFCFDHPNADDSFSSLVEQFVEDYLHGAAAIEMQLSGDAARPLWLWPVDGLSIQIYPAWSSDRNEARYAQVVGYGTAFGGGTVAQLRNDELIYARPNPSTATPFGFGPLEIAFNTINVILGVSEYAGNVASNMRSSIGIDLGEGISQQDVLAFRGYWQNEIEGQGKVPITSLGGANNKGDKKARGINVYRLYPEGDTGLFLKYQEFLIRTCAVAFDLSPQNFSVEADVNRNTSEVAEDRDWNQAIKPVAFQVESHLTREALHGKLGFSQLRFKFVGLDREDELSNAEIYNIRYEGNAITPNEYREALGQPPIDSEFGDMVHADVEIAKDAARGAAQVLDNKLTKSGGKPKAKAKPKKD